MRNAAAIQSAEHTVFRPVERADNEAVAALVRAVLEEFRLTGEGCAYADPELDRMYDAYRAENCGYVVAEQGGRIVGGGGIAPLKGAAARMCELQKFYLLPAARGQGLGRELLGQCFRAARQLGYRECYVETIRRMHAAVALYERNGFRHLAAPLGDTGHYRCEIWMVKEL